MKTQERFQVSLRGQEEGAPWEGNVRLSGINHEALPTSAEESGSDVRERKEEVRTKEISGAQPRYCFPVTCEYTVAMVWSSFFHRRVSLFPIGTRQPSTLLPWDLYATEPTRLPETASKRVAHSMNANPNFVFSVRPWILYSLPPWYSAVQTTLGRAVPGKCRLKTCRRIE